MIRIGGGLFGDMPRSSKTPFHQLATLPAVPYSAETGQDGVAIIRNIPARAGDLEVEDPHYQVPWQEPKGWRDRFVRVAFKADETNRLTMVLEPKGTDYIGTAR